MAIGDELDQMFLIFMGMIVFFMQCGFAFLEAGAVRSKNVTNILIKNVFDSFVSGVAYWLIGYAFAFGDGNDFIGYKFFASYELPETQYAMFFFQYTFAATAATIVSGAVAERCEFLAYFVYSFCITGFIYPLVTHWVWGGGFLAQGKDYGGEIGVIAYQDYAGSGVVHCLGGTAAFIGAALLGPRIGRFHKETKTVIQIRGHSVPIAALGGFILFFGFLAFNGGSQTSISNNGDGAAISRAVINTIISGSFAAFSSLIINRSPLFGNKSWSLLITINGALTGMVAACAGCNVIEPWGACVIGCISGIAYHLLSWIVRSLTIDDPLDAVAVHFGGGSLGVIALAFLHKEDGILFNWDERSALILGWQVAGLVAITAWSAVTSLLVFGSMRLLKVLRVPEDIEIRGLDIPKHNEPGYPVEAYGHGHVENILQILAQSGPYKVTQAFEKLKGSDNIGFSTVSDEGPYENPEVRRTLHQTEAQHAVNNKSAVSRDTSNGQVPHVVETHSQPVHLQEPVRIQEPIGRTYIQQPRYHPNGQQPVAYRVYEQPTHTRHIRL